MPLLSIVFGILLGALGAYAFLSTGGTHYTALIPAGFGAILLICGVIAKVAPGARKHVMHVAALVGLIGVLGGLGRSIPKLISTGEWTTALTMQFTMGVLSLIFVALCVRSFIAARKAMAKS